LKSFEVLKSAVSPSW